MSLREHNRRVRREALVDAAARLFEDVGYENPTVDRIAESAGLSRRTYFRYFPGKEDVAFPDHADRLAFFEDAIAGEGAAWERVKQGFVALGGSLTADRARVTRQQRIIECSPALVAADRRRDLEWDAVVARALHPEHANASILAGALMGAIRATLRAWFTDDGATDLIAEGLRAFELLEVGVRRSAKQARTAD